MTTYNLIKSTLAGEFESGFVAASLADGVTGLSWGDGSTVFQDEGPADKAALVAGLMEEVAALEAQILAGEIAICDALNDPTSDACVALGVSS